MKKNIFIITTAVIMFLLCSILQSQDKMWGSHHQYVTTQAWYLVCAIHPEASTSSMNDRIGLNNIVRGTVLWSSSSEDDEEIMYDYGLCGADYTGTHFMKLEELDEDDESYIHIGPCSYPNALMKAKNFWFGKVYEESERLFLSMRFRDHQNNNFDVLVKYNNLMDAIHNHQNIWMADNTPLKNRILEITPMTVEEVDNQIDEVLYDVLGRICHLLQDMSTPAHTHEDIHIPEPPFNNGDYYEESYLNTYHTQIDYQDAILRGGIMNINYIHNPLRSIFVALNRATTRIPSRDEDAEFPGYDPKGDGFFIYRMTHPILFNLRYLDLVWETSHADLICDSTLTNAFNASIRAVAGFLWYVYSNTSPRYDLPVVGSVIQYPPIISSNSTGYIYCNLSSGNFPDVDYTWSWHDKPDYITISVAQGCGYVDDDDSLAVTTNSNYIKINVAPNMKMSPKEINKNFRIHVNAENNNGTSYHSAPYPVRFQRGYIPIGCPWIYVETPDTSVIAENNVLHKSQLPQYAGQFITDRYVLKNKPGKFESRYLISLVETDFDSTLFNSVKLYAVDHPYGTKIAITENNTIVAFDSASVIQDKVASLYDPDNNYLNITDKIRFHTSNIDLNFASGDSLYNLYAEFYGVQFTNPGVISYSQRGTVNPIYPIAKDYFSGNINTNTPEGMFSMPFMRRENPDVVVFEVPNSSENFTGYVDSVHISWDKSFKIKYAAVANLQYSGFTVTELPLVYALNSNTGDVLTDLLNNDSLYSFTSQNSYLDLEFKDSVTGSETIRDYVFEVNGKIIVPGSKNMVLLHKSGNQNDILPNKYSISQNYPNPFNPVTKIDFAVPKQSLVSIKVYDMLGREVFVLLNDVKNPGNYSLVFNAGKLASGIYFYRMVSGNFTETKRFVLIK